MQINWLNPFSRHFLTPTQETARNTEHEVVANSQGVSDAPVKILHSAEPWSPFHLHNTGGTGEYHLHRHAQKLVQSQNWRAGHNRVSRN